MYAWVPAPGPAPYTHGQEQDERVGRAVTMDERTRSTVVGSVARQAGDDDERGRGAAVRLLISHSPAADRRATRSGRHGVCAEWSEIGAAGRNGAVSARFAGRLCLCGRVHARRGRRAGATLPGDTPAGRAERGT